MSDQVSVTEARAIDRAELQWLREARHRLRDLRPVPVPVAEEEGR